MDTGPLALQVESVERNIAFLQKEHQLLLTGLRLEIRHLKKRCNGLSFPFPSLVLSGQLCLLLASCTYM
uniref:CCDC92/74 N-terminal domain-containing protein n=1 Tax=Electrophorus electricus TaxID=8005 RepID=A0A4W4GUF1_ELEEL